MMQKEKNSYRIGLLFDFCWRSLRCALTELITLSVSCTLYPAPYTLYPVSYTLYPPPTSQFTNQTGFL